MEIIGKLVKVLPEQSGQSANGTWVRGGFVIETEEQFPRSVAFSLWGEERVNAIKNIRIGSQIRATFSPESREYQERWYTDLRCFKIETFNPVVGNDQMASTSVYQNAPSYPSNNAAQMNDTPVAPAPVEENFNQAPTEDDDLPF